MKISTGKGEITIFALLAIWSVSAVTSLPGLAISPILEDLSRIFPSASQLEIQMLTSLPSLLIIPFVLLSGWLSVRGGESLRLLAVGLAIFFASGLACIFAKDIRLLIVASCIMGAGAGIAVPYSTGLVVRYFTGDARVQQLGISSAVNNLSLVLATAVVGWIATRDWHLAFTVYLLPAVSLVMLLALRGVKSAPEPKESDQLRQSKIQWGRLAGLSVLYFIITFTTLVITFYLSFLLEKYHFPQELSSVMISLFFLAIMLPGLILNLIISRVRSMTIFVSLCLIVVGLLLVGTVPDVPLMTLGVVLTGVGYGVLQPIIYDKTAIIAPPETATKALSVVMTVNYVAVVVCPFVVDFAERLFRQKEESFPFVASAVLVAMVAFLSLLMRKSFVLGLDDSYYSSKK
ncbi:MAG: MFS transporter [Rikenellaceae bacterium]|nr:MFS transporter [Rikenellaceae bacterium]